MVISQAEPKQRKLSPYLAPALLDPVLAELARPIAEVHGRVLGAGVEPMVVRPPSPAVVVLDDARQVLAVLLPHRVGVKPSQRRGLGIGVGGGRMPF